MEFRTSGCCSRATCVSSSNSRQGEGKGGPRGDRLAPLARGAARPDAGRTRDGRAADDARRGGRRRPAVAPGPGGHRDRARAGGEAPPQRRPPHALPRGRWGRRGNRRPGGGRVRRAQRAGRQAVPLRPVGAVLPGGVKLERKTIRGVESNGMLCSAKELGLGEDHAGILEVDTSAAPGTRFTDVVPVADHQIVIDVPASRPDLLCHKGVARELGASLAIPVKLPLIPGSHGIPVPSFRREEREGVVDSVAVRLEDPEGAPRYMVAVIRGVRVGESPAWLSGRLTAVGQRPINNVVDATNYVLLELNQPLHAFDLAKLRGPAVVVRRARPAEQIVTLDGLPRPLTPEMTAICA